MARDHRYKILFVCFLLLLLISFRNTDRVTENMSLVEFTEYLDERIPELMKVYDIPGVSIAVVREGEIAWSSAYGYADLEAGRLMTFDTVCRAESISKPVTAWGVMNLVEEGLIDLNDPVMNHIDNWTMPESEYDTNGVTIEQLLSHTSGMPLGTIGVHYSPNSDMPSLKDILSNEVEIISEPGTGFSYSNTGFNLLELMIEEVTERDFAEYMNETVLSPLGMKHSSYDFNPYWDPTVPNGYDTNGEKIPPYVYPDKGSGGLFGTVKDFARFAVAGMADIRGEAVLQSETLETMYTSRAKDIGFYRLVFDSYGLGYFIEWLDGSVKAVAHGGQGSGWMTHMVTIPETGDAIVILSNSQRSWPFFGYILSDWVHWLGFKGIGMGSLVLGRRLLSVVVGGIVGVSVFKSWLILSGLFTGNKIIRLNQMNNRASLPKVVFSLLILGVLSWSYNQKYLIIRSAFPITSVWLGISLLSFAIVMLFSAIITRNGKNSIENSF